MIDAAKAIVEAGIVFSRCPLLLPTLIIEKEGEMSINVLDSYPETNDLFEIAMEWKLQILGSQEGQNRHCIAFMSAPESIALGCFPPSQGDWHSGHVDVSKHTVSWIRKTPEKGL